MASRFAPTVRLRTTALATMFVTLALTVGSIVLMTSLGRSLVRSADDLSRARTHDLAQLAAAEALPELLTDVGDESVAQVVGADGRVLAASANVRGHGPVTTFRPPSGGEPVLRIVENAPDDGETESYRLWVLTSPSPTGPVTVYAGTSLEAVPEASRTLQRVLLLGVPLTVLLLAVSTWLLTSRALRPVEAIRSMVARISERELDRRVPVPKADDEVRRLAVTMNGMLDRLDESNRRQREFVADASHELQSPVAAIRTQLEVALAHQSRTDWPELTATILADCDQMERLVHDLLFLAQERDATRPLEHRPLDLDDLVLEEASRARPTGVRVDTSRVSAGPTVGSSDDLRRLVRNLLDNALRHARSVVRLSVWSADGRTRLDVVDDGPGVPAGESELVFERFHRADASRSRDSGGTGLGLPIARAIAERHGGTLSLVDEGEAGAHFALDLPSDGPLSGGS